METETEFDIKRAASQVVDEFERAGWEQARAVLEQQRRSRPAVVQEAIDRFVVADMKEQLLRFRDGSSAADVVIDRVLAASGPPRFPSNDEMSALASDSQRHDVYASIVATRGTPTAVNALARGERVLLGLRQENSTLESMDDPRTRIDESTLRSGKGVYDDRVLVIWNDDLGDRHAEPFDQANTEPTAQYDHHVGSDGRRPFADGSVEQRRIVAASGFDNVVPPRKIEGEDVDGDGLRDLGRLAEGTIEMRMGWHPRPGGRGVLEHALQPTVEAVRTGREGVQRDTNADGWFTTADIGGRDELNASFKIHRGSRLNTDSAGCQTIHFDDYARFLRVVEGNPHQTRWQYVLTSTTPGMFRNVTHDAPLVPGERAGEAAAQGREDRVPRHEGHGGPARRGDATAPGHPDARDPRDPRHPAHPDHADYRRTHELLRDADARHGIGFDEAGLQRATLGLMAQARLDPTVRRIDEVAFSGATDMHPAGHFVAAIHRPYGEREPAFAVRVETQALLQRPVEEALRQLGDAGRQAREQGLAVEPTAQRQREALVRTI